ncbi:nucleotidyltransferase domain-containing protein [Leptolyngbya sp. CCNP1308]|uniref:nucleotidyltransferase domain-containing protein n=1 Tax=Leptolyngbya sp. CCNP1308 TaxID=3110255 RepID=UPI002B1FB938|nr:nucleotidyltransferase domain-containing protein [Leptolyngbya sp. CCNP1308]MEA5450432.1 nucleotidyltransferase domain-containing protein [Leptolyngbya sp. CCNP1308]
MPPLTPDLLDHITQRLVTALQPEQIILFGSYAYGEPTADSDIDLLVIVSQSDEPRYRRARVAYKALRGIGMPTDVLVMTREEVQRKLNVRSSFIRRAVNEGKLLYEGYGRISSRFCHAKIALEVYVSGDSAATGTLVYGGDGGAAAAVCQRLLPLRAHHLGRAGG